MYQELIGQQVSVICAMHSEHALEYFGVLEAEDEKGIKLSNVTIRGIVPRMQTNMWGAKSAAWSDIHTGMAKTIVNKDHIISCSH
jgi:hypothetical protein